MPFKLLHKTNLIKHDIIKTQQQTKRANIKNNLNFFFSIHRPSKGRLAVLNKKLKEIQVNYFLPFLTL